MHPDPVQTQLIVFVRWPNLGRVKTRLAATIGNELALRLYEAFVNDTMERCVGSTGARLAERVVVAFTPDDAPARQYFERFVTEGVTLWPQPDGTLGERLVACFNEHCPQAEATVVIGSDSPTLPGEFITDAFQRLQTSDCVIGPSTDGGYYLIGLSQPCASLFEKVAWDGPNVLLQTLVRRRAAGRSLSLLPPWYDVDTFEDLRFLTTHLMAMNDATGESTAPQTWDVINGEGGPEGADPAADEDD